MNEFMNIMRLMNNGLHNDSTLKEVIPRISALAMKKNPSNIEYVMTWMLEEECLSRPHPGLNETIMACQNVIQVELQKQRQINVEKEVVANPTR